MVRFDLLQAGQKGRVPGQPGGLPVIGMAGDLVGNEEHIGPVTAYGVDEGVAVRRAGADAGVRQFEVPPFGQPEHFRRLRRFPFPPVDRSPGTHLAQAHVDDSGGISQVGETDHQSAAVQLHVVRVRGYGEYVEFHRGVILCLKSVSSVASKRVFMTSNP